VLGEARQVLVERQLGSTQYQIAARWLLITVMTQRWTQRQSSDSKPHSTTLKKVSFSKSWRHIHYLPCSQHQNRKKKMEMKFSSKTIHKTDRTNNTREKRFLNLQNSITFTKRFKKRLDWRCKICSNNTSKKDFSERAQTVWLLWPGYFDIWVTNYVTDSVRKHKFC
jgi:hypothetical protein